MSDSGTAAVAVLQLQHYMVYFSNNLRTWIGIPGAPAFLPPPTAALCATPCIPALCILMLALALHNAPAYA
jgi:hypothetical protein